MAAKNRHDTDSPTDDEFATVLFDKLKTEILVEILRQRITAGQVNAADVVHDLVDDKEAVVVIMKGF